VGLAYCSGCDIICVHQELYQSHFQQAGLQAGLQCVLLTQHFYCALVGERNIAISLPVCLCVCLSVHKHITGTAGLIVTKFFVQIPCGCGSVLLWRHCCTLCTSGLWMTSRFAVMGRMAIPGLSVTKYSAPSAIAISEQSLKSVNALLFAV